MSTLPKFALTEAEASDSEAALSRLYTGESLTETEAEALFAKLVAGRLPEPAIAAMLVALRLKGEGAGELTGAARALCAKLRIDLHVERPKLGDGNLQANAREARYAAAERLRERLGGEWIATGHTRTDLAETFLYRLATSPGTQPFHTCG